jgi:hypothetical protein
LYISNVVAPSSFQKIVSVPFLPELLSTTHCCAIPSSTLLPGAYLAVMLRILGQRQTTNKKPEISVIDHRNHFDDERVPLDSTLTTRCLEAKTVYFPKQPPEAPRKGDGSTLHRSENISCKTSIESSDWSGDGAGSRQIDATWLVIPDKARFSFGSPLGRRRQLWLVVLELGPPVAL